MKVTLNNIGKKYESREDFTLRHINLEIEDRYFNKKIKHESGSWDGFYFCAFYFAWFRNTERLDFRRIWMVGFWYRMELDRKDICAKYLISFAAKAVITLKQVKVYFKMDFSEWYKNLCVYI